MAQSDATELDQEGKEHPKRRFDARDWGHIADQVIDEWTARKKRRSDVKAKRGSAGFDD